jgi:hypothetical protein
VRRSMTNVAWQETASEAGGVPVELVRDARTGDDHLRAAGYRPAVR